MMVSPSGVRHSTRPLLVDGFEDGVGSILGRRGHELTAACPAAGHRLDLPCRSWVPWFGDHAVAPQTRLAMSSRAPVVNSKEWMTNDDVAA